MNIVIISPGMRHDGTILKNRSLGGSETAAIQLAEAFTKVRDPFGNKNRVVVFSPCDAQALHNNVFYTPIDVANDYIATADIDLLIVSRQPDFLVGPHNAKVCLLWCHDLALKRFFHNIHGVLYQVNKLLVMSEFQKEQYKLVYKLPDEAFSVIRNGIDLSIFPESNSKKRVKGQMVYCARPERGLENLVKEGGIMERLLAANVPVTLTVAHYDNVTPRMEAYYAWLWERCNALSNVKLVGFLTKEQLYDLYSRSWLYCYPTEFEEISCISAMEAQACGLPVITCPVAALKETLDPDACRFIDIKASTPTCHDAFVEAIKWLLDSEEAWGHMSAAGYTKAQTLGWEPVVRQLLGIAEESFVRNVSEKSRLYKHFWRMSDIEACKALECEPGFELDTLPQVRKEFTDVLDHYGFMESEEAYREQYVKVGNSVSTDASLYETSKTEVRYGVLADFVTAHADTITSVLDYGCNIGHQTIRVANLLPNAQVVGVDIDERTVDIARECAKEHSEHTNVEFRTTWHTLDTQFDLVVCNEVLEHVLDPYALVDILESYCKPGGKIYLNVPYGPWEHMSFNTYPYRNHIRHFEMNDLMDVFGAKKDVQLKYRAVTRDTTGVPLGHHYVVYTHDPECKTGKINMERKLRWQAPRETLSVCMIAYNAESMLHRCLKSVSKVADEIVIAVDPKTTDSTREIAAMYGAKVVEGIDPLADGNGFGAARNVSIEHATSDWILWIDSDEELLQAEKVCKYLKTNLYHGYTVQQHHLSVDPPVHIPPDLPVRIIRNHCGMRFYGLIHEHPEVALNGGTGIPIVLTDIWIAHDGYLTEDIRRNRFLRNVDLVMKDIEENPDRELIKFLALRDYIHIIRYRMEGKQGPPTEECRQWALKAKRLFEDVYLDYPEHPMAVEALKLYTAANDTLNIGQQVMFSINVNGAEIKDVKARFPNSVMASKFIGALIGNKIAEFEGEYQ